MPRPAYDTTELPAATPIAVSDKLLRLAASTEPHPYREAVTQELQDGLAHAAAITKGAVHSRRTHDILANRYAIRVGPSNRFAAAVMLGTAGPDGTLWRMRRRTALRVLGNGDFDSYLTQMGSASHHVGGVMGSWQGSSMRAQLTPSNSGRIPRLRQSSAVTLSASPLDVMLMGTQLLMARPSTRVNIHTSSGGAAFAALPLFGAVELLWAAGWLPRPAAPVGDAVTSAVANNFNPDKIVNGADATWPEERALAWLSQMAAPTPQYVQVSNFSTSTTYQPVWPFDPPPPDTEPERPVAPITNFSPPSHGPRHLTAAQREAANIELSIRLAGYSWLTPNLVSPATMEEILGGVVPNGTVVVLIDDTGALDFLWRSSSLYYDAYELDRRVSFTQNDMRANALGSDFYDGNTRQVIRAQMRGRVFAQRRFTLHAIGTTRTVYFLDDVQNNHSIANGGLGGSFDAHYGELAGDR